MDKHTNVINLSNTHGQGNLKAIAQQTTNFKLKKKKDSAVSINYSNYDAINF